MQTKNPLQTIRDLNSLGARYLALRDHALAVELHRMALGVAATLPSCASEVECCQLLASALTLRGCTGAALPHLERACELCDQLQDYPSALKARLLLGEAYLRCWLCCVA